MHSFHARKSMDASALGTCRWRRRVTGLGRRRVHENTPLHKLSWKFVRSPPRPPVLYTFSRSTTPPPRDMGKCPNVHAKMDERMVLAREGLLVGWHFCVLGGLIMVNTWCLDGVWMVFAWGLDGFYMVFRWLFTWLTQERCLDDRNMMFR